MENETTFYSPEATFERNDFTSSTWHDFTSSDNPLYLYSCPGIWPQMSCSRCSWDSGYPRSMLNPWGNSREAHLVPMLPIPLHQCNLTSSSRLSPDGTPGPSLVPSTPNMSQEISARHGFFTSGRPRSPSSPGFPSTTVPFPLKTRCMKLQWLWRHSRNSQEN